MVYYQAQLNISRHVLPDDLCKFVVDKWLSCDMALKWSILLDTQDWSDSPAPRYEGGDTGLDRTVTTPLPK